MGVVYLPVALSDQLKIPKYPIGAIFGTIRTISITKNPPQKKRPVVLIAKRLDLTVKPGQPKFTLRTCLPPAPSAPPPAVPWAVLDYRCSRVHRILTVLAIRCCARFASLDLGFVHGGGGGFRPEADCSWSDFRGKVLGPTDPADAPYGMASTSFWSISHDYQNVF